MYLFQYERQSLSSCSSVLTASTAVNIYLGAANRAADIRQGDRTLGELSSVNGTVFPLWRFTGKICSGGRIKGHFCANLCSLLPFNSLLWFPIKIGPWATAVIGGQMHSVEAPLPPKSEKPHSVSEVANTCVRQPSFLPFVPSLASSPSSEQGPSSSFTPSLVISSPKGLQAF